jgi:hypothetical protein
MNTAFAWESDMTVEDRVGKLESEFHSFRTEVAKEFSLIRAEMAEKLGLVNIALERAKLWMLVTCISTLATMFMTLGHALKLF